MSKFVVTVKSASNQYYVALNPNAIVGARSFKSLEVSSIQSEAVRYMFATMNIDRVNAKVASLRAQLVRSEKAKKAERKLSPAEITAIREKITLCDVALATYTKDQSGHRDSYTKLMACYPIEARLNVILYLRTICAGLMPSLASLVFDGLKGENGEVFSAIEASNGELYDAISEASDVIINFSKEAKASNEAKSAYNKAKAKVVDLLSGMLNFEESEFLFKNTFRINNDDFSKLILSNFNGVTNKSTVTNATVNFADAEIKFRITKTERDDMVCYSYAPLMTQFAKILVGNICYKDADAMAKAVSDRKIATDKVVIIPASEFEVKDNRSVTEAVDVAAMVEAAGLETANK